MDYLSFKSFISIPFFVTIYYAGAFFLPALLWYKREQLKKLVGLFQNKFPLFTTRLILIFAIIFFIAEIMWRMMFEMIIGYFQMREYLQQIAG